MVTKIGLLFFTLFICADVHIANAKPRSSKKRQHTSNTCTYDQQTEFAIEFEESEASGAKFLGAASKDNLDSCQEQCCQHNGCTLALFYNTNATENCYFIRCIPSDVCTFTNHEDFSISTVSTDGEESDINEKEEEYDTVTWPEWLFDGNEPVASKPLTSDQLHASPSDSTPETLPHVQTTSDSLPSGEGTMPETAGDNSTTSSLAQTTTSPVAVNSSGASSTSSPMEQASSYTTLSLSETSSNSVSNISAEPSPTPTINLPSSSSPPSTGGGSSTPLVNTSTSGESASVSVTDKSADVTTQHKNDVHQTTDAPDIETTTIPLQDTTYRAPTTTELPAQPTATQQHTTTSHITEPNHVVEDITTETRPSTDFYVDVTELISDTGYTTNMRKPVNTTTTLMKDGRLTYNKLSSNGALIASLCFSVLFACAVCVLLGKRWYEGYQRRHYSKVDYLINGMYN